MDVNNNEIMELLDVYLPHRYAEEIVNSLKSKGLEVTASMVRNVKTGRPASKKTLIMAALVEMASKEKAALEELSKQLN